MNTPSEKNATNGTGAAKTADQTQKSGPYNNAPAVTNSERVLHIKPAAQEVVRPVAPKHAIKEPFVQTPALNAAKAPKLAAQGDDDLMSQK